MSDRDKTREQLIEELGPLRGMVAELRQENAKFKSNCQCFQSALHESERRFKALLYNLPEKVFHKDRESVYVSCNRNYAADCGLEPERMVGKNDYDFFPPETAAKYRADDQRLMASGATEEIEESYFTRLRESKERLQMALEVSRSFTFEWDVATDRVSRSDSCSRILGLSPDVAPYDTGQRFFQRIHISDRDRFVRMLSELKPSANTYRAEYRVIRGDGVTVVLEESACGFFDNNGMLRRLVGVTTDITERKHAEAALRANYAELFAAAEIQDRLLPQEAPQVPGFDIAGRCYPAEAAAGDHFDFLHRPDGSLLLVMGDVSGHGIGPAIVAADFCARLRTLAETPCELPEIAAKVNAGLYRETAGEIFVTALLGRLEPQSRTLTYVNAGHPSAFVLNAAGEIKASLASGGVPFAIMLAAPPLADESVELADGDLLLVYTDGLTEVRRRGEPLFGIERVLDIARANLDRTAGEIIETLHRAAYHYAGAEKPRDDITVVVVKVLPRASDLPPALRPPDGVPLRLPVPAKSRRRSVIGAAHFSAEQCDDVTIVRLVDTSRFDTDQYSQLQQELVDFVERQQPPKLLVDLGSVEYESSGLISVLLIAQKRVEAGSGVMKLFGTREVVLETLQCLNLTNTVFSVYADEATARNAF